MPLSNTSRSFGSLSRWLHWLTAGLILIALPLGVIANDLPFDTSEELLQKAWLFSLHKTLGVMAFFTGLLRILWAVTQVHPAPLHPERRLETRLATLIHWMLYISLIAVPLTGWVHHAATTGFAPILWPFGQGLPFIPTSETVAGLGAAMHWTFTKLLALSVILHVAGALKHHLIDRDATLRRMVSGAAAPDTRTPATAPRTLLPAIAATGLFVAASAFAVVLSQPATPLPVSQPDVAAQPAQEGNWTVEEGQLGITVAQLGSAVTGQFDRWQADIRFDDSATPPTGSVTTLIDMTSLRLGSVTSQAQSADFLDTAAHAEARFEAEIAPNDQGEGYIATGTLTLRGVTHPVTLAFGLNIAEDTARMTGSTTLDRRDFGIGQSYGDEATVGFSVTVDIALTARRATAP
jgi:cytochrome b561/polyisoprenoid-binding protein YceI